jgi:hypothetical protein
MALRGATKMSLNVLMRSKIPVDDGAVETGLVTPVDDGAVETGLVGCLASSSS